MSKFSDSLNTKLAETIKTNLDGFAVTFFNGAIPINASDAVTGQPLITFTVNNDGVTGGTWTTPTTPLLVRNAGEVMRGTCILGDSPTFFRLHKLGEAAGTANTSFYRIQGKLGQAQASGILDSTFFPMTLGTEYPLGTIVLPPVLGA
jgi:hypothetical protein